MKSLPQFVSFLVSAVNSKFQSASWRFSSTNDNPADLQTRGFSYDWLQSSFMWLNGPPWLLSENLWRPTISHFISGSRRNTKLHSSGNYWPPLYYWCFSLQQSILSLQWNNIYVLKFIWNTRKPSIRYTSSISPAEVQYTSQLEMNSDCTKTIVHFWNPKLWFKI